MTGNSSDESDVLSDMSPPPINMPPLRPTLKIPKQLLADLLELCRIPVKS